MGLNKKMKHWIFVQKRRFGYRRAGKNVNTGDVKVFVLGNQKAGTSVIAALLAERVGLTYSIDLKEEMHEPLIPAVASGETTLEKLINRNALDFSNQLVKEPGLTLLYSQLSATYPGAKFIFIVRDPFDNIRSILNRLGVAGNRKALSISDKKKLSSTWRSIIFNDKLSIDANSYIEHMAFRWNLFASMFIDKQDEVILVKYEDFMKDKLSTIDNLVKKLGYKPKNEISHLMDKQFQSKGSPVNDYVKFFGSDNYDKIAEICSTAARRLGYKYDKTSN